MDIQIEKVFQYLENVSRPFVLSNAETFHKILKSDMGYNYIQSLRDIFQTLQVDFYLFVPKKRGRPKKIPAYIKEAVFNEDEDEEVEENIKIPAKIRSNRSMAELNVRYFDEAKQLRKIFLNGNENNAELMLMNIIAS